MSELDLEAIEARVLQTQNRPWNPNGLTPPFDPDKPKLIAEIKSLREENARLKETLDHHTCPYCGRSRDIELEEKA